MSSPALVDCERQGAVKTVILQGWWTGSTPTPPPAPQLGLFSLLPVSGPAAFSPISEFNFIKYSNSFSLFFGKKHEDELLTTYNVCTQLTGGKGNRTFEKLCKLFHFLNFTRGKNSKQHFRRVQAWRTAALKSKNLIVTRKNVLTHPCADYFNQPVSQKPHMQRLCNTHCTQTHTLLHIKVCVYAAKGSMSH